MFCYVATRHAVSPMARLEDSPLSQMPIFLLYHFFSSIIFES